MSESVVREPTNAAEPIVDAPSCGARPPGPGRRPDGLLRNLPYYMQFARRPLDFVGERFERYGDIYFAPTKSDDLYVIRHPEHLREVLVTHATDYEKKHTGLNRLRTVLGAGLLTTDGTEWRRARRMLQPAFSARALAGYADAMIEETTRSLCRLRDDAERDLFADMTELTLRIVGQTLFSQDVGEDASAIASAMRSFHRSLARPPVLPTWVPGSAQADSDRAAADLHRIIDAMVTRRREGDDPPRADLLQLLLDARDEEAESESGAGLTNQEIRDHLITFYLAGHETTSNALAWTWVLLSQNPSAEAALHRELDRELGGRIPRFEDVPNLRYTEAVLKEAMRLYPPAYVVARRACRPTRIGPYDLEAGAEVIAWIYFAHRDGRWYPEPLAFKPERFLDGSDKDRPKNSYLPFGAGSRACIGSTFAMLEAKLIVATLAQRYRFLCKKAKVRAKPRITLMPSGGVPALCLARR